MSQTLDEGRSRPDELGEPPTHRFYLAAHLTFVTDDEGTVTRLEISPFQEDPVNEDGTDPDGRVFDLAEGKGWELDALCHLPEGIRWEV